MNLDTLRHYTLTDIHCPACRRGRLIALLGADNETMYLSCRACDHTIRAVELLAVCQPATQRPVVTQPTLFGG